MATKTHRAESDILATVHESVSGLHKAGLVDQATMRSFEALCLTTVEKLSPAEIRALREREQVSQAVFSRYLNVRKDAVSKWERGEKHPDGPSLKLLNLVKAKGLQAIA
ncbi:transcriptional regulator, XRE family [Tistlia consotensis]|uniref:Transcriptional regulator, XRE family n=1 Tax=Tistlia consotensis USBA 355 TaxID=560819 RepID=A0A1Y6CRV1_9PROT|nr:DNA-binding transcriptional regulator [Tistlia consotensis]SMF84117.1 transcriptional regulator, XRE family [Tistlia consotensis USBA 355]SNS35975.1 transcriptional regulator, XRE family [Tistlia consotensis]